MSEPCCPHSVERHAYNGCSNCSCDVRWDDHPDKMKDRSASGMSVVISILTKQLAAAEQRVQDTLAAWTDDLNKRVAPFVAIVEAAKAWREVVARAPVNEVQQRLVMDAIELIRAIDAATTKEQPVATTAPEKWAACDDPADGDGVPACGWTGEMSQLVDRGIGVLFCPACGSSAIKEDLDPWCDAWIENDVAARDEFATGNHPVSWLDCPDCRARSKSGAEPPRCEVWIANEAKQWSGKCPAGKHGLDYEGQACDVCAKAKR